MSNKRVMLTRPEYARAPVTRAHLASKTKSGMGGGMGPLIRGPSPHLSQSAQINKEKVGVDEVLKLVEQLTQVERQELLDRLALAQSNEAGDPREVEMWCGAVHEALQDALGPSAGAMGGHALIKRLVGSPSHWKPVALFMTTSGLGDLQVRERQLAYGLIADLLVKHVIQLAHFVGAPLGLKFVGNNLGAIPGVFEAAFPGYLGAGLAPVIVKGLGHN